MTSVQLAHRCARMLREKDLTRMPANVLLEILDACNAALQKAYEFLPSHNRETTITAVLRAPATVTYTFPAKYENVMTSSIFTEGQKGCTVHFSHDAGDNEIVAPNAVLDSYLGTTLTGTATVYGDALPILAVIEKIIGAPRVYDGGRMVSELARDQELRARHASRQMGLPLYYLIENAGSSQGAEPESFLRVHPMPDRDLRVRFEALLATFRITFTQVSIDAVNLPLPDQLCERTLIPLAQAELLASNFWENEGTKAEVRARAEAAIGTLRRQPMDLGTGNNTVGTEEGF